MSQSQTMPADFLEASLSMQDLLTGIYQDLASVRLSSAELYQHLRVQLLQACEKMPAAVITYRESIQKMPLELRRRAVVKRVVKDMESLEKEMSVLFERIKASSAQDLRESFGRHVKDAEAGLKAIQIRLQGMSGDLENLEQHALVQKFLRGEIILSSKKNMQWGRKAGHAALGCFFLYLIAFSGLAQSTIWMVTGPFFIWAFALETVRHFNPRVNEWVCRYFRPVMREAEKTRVNSAIFYMAAMAIVYFAFPLQVAIVTMLFIAIGDPVAGIVGVYWGRHKVAPHVSLEGSAACALSCALMAGLCAGFLFEHTLSFLGLLLFATLSGLVGALAESSFKKLDDNLVMPMLSAPVLWGLMKVFGIL